MAKKTDVKVRSQIKLPKTLEDELTREAQRQGVFKSYLVETALKEMLHPIDKESHEKHSKMQLARLQREMISVHNKLDMVLVCFEELVKTLYRLNPDVDMDMDAKFMITLMAKVQRGQEGFVKRVLDSLINNKPNILSAANLVRSEDAE